MKFNYFSVDDEGWATLLFEDKNVSLNYRISDVGDSLNQLLSGIIGIIGSKYQLESIDNIHRYFAYEKVEFEWNLLLNNFDLLFVRIDGSDLEEKSKRKFVIKVKFIFSKMNDSEFINLKIIELSDKEECVYNDKFELNDLIDNILFSCSEILRKYGIIGFSKNFRIDFPIVYYLILKDFKKNEIKFDLLKENINQSKEVMFKSDFSKEIELLSSENSRFNQ